MMQPERLAPGRLRVQPHILIYLPSEKFKIHDTLGPRHLVCTCAHNAFHQTFIRQFDTANIEAPLVAGGFSFENPDIGRWIQNQVVDHRLKRSFILYRVPYSLEVGLHGFLSFPAGVALLFKRGPGKVFPNHIPGPMVPPACSNGSGRPYICLTLKPSPSLNSECMSMIPLPLWRYSTNLFIFR